MLWRLGWNVRPRFAPAFITCISSKSSAVPKIVLSTTLLVFGSITGPASLSILIGDVGPSERKESAFTFFARTTPRCLLGLFLNELADARLATLALGLIVALLNWSFAPNDWSGAATRNNLMRRFFFLRLRSKATPAELLLFADILQLRFC